MSEPREETAAGPWKQVTRKTHMFSGGAPGYGLQRMDYFDAVEVDAARAADLATLRARDTQIQQLMVERKEAAVERGVMRQQIDKLTQEPFRLSQELSLARSERESAVRQFQQAERDCQRLTEERDFQQRRADDLSQRLGGALDRKFDVECERDDLAAQLRERDQTIAQLTQQLKDLT